MTTGLWLVWGFFGVCTLIVGLMLLVDEVNQWWDRRRGEREFAESVIAWAQREEALRAIGRVPRDRSAA